jgi:hypothetical protein
VIQKSAMTQDQLLGEVRSLMARAQVRRNERSGARIGELSPGKRSDSMIQASHS